jgi:hypothetical protein
MDTSMGITAGGHLSKQTPQMQTLRHLGVMRVPIHPVVSYNKTDHIHTSGRQFWCQIRQQG